MKKNILFLIITVLIIFSCSDPGGDPTFEGFEFSIWNKTSNEYDIKIITGGMQNGIFVPTDSIVMQQKIKMNSYFSYNNSENRWRPSLDKIRAIPSERCYFKIKLSNQREEMIGRYNQQVLMSLLLPGEDFFTDDYGRLLISIRDTKITGRAAKEL